MCIKNSNTAIENFRMERQAVSRVLRKSGRYLQSLIDADSPLICRMSPLITTVTPWCLLKYKHWACLRLLVRSIGIMGRYSSIQRVFFAIKFEDSPDSKQRRERTHTVPVWWQVSVYCRTLPQSDVSNSTHNTVRLPFPVCQGCRFRG